MSQSAVKFEGTSRIHIGLDVAHLDQSIAFYRVLLGEAPVKVRPGYAKFEPQGPSINLSLNEGLGGPHRRSGSSQHFGLQVQSTDAVKSMALRLDAAGIRTHVEEDSACCYAVQSKVWAEDPDGNPWEIFVVTQADSEQRASSGSSCCGSSTSTVAAPDSTTCCGGAASR